MVPLGSSSLCDAQFGYTATELMEQSVVLGETVGAARGEPMQRGFNNAHYPGVSCHSQGEIAGM